MTTPQRSYNMSRIRGKDTKPEMIVRKYLWAHGVRLHVCSNTVKTNTAPQQNNSSPYYPESAGSDYSSSYDYNSNTQSESASNSSNTGFQTNTSNTSTRLSTGSNYVLPVQDAEEDAYEEARSLKEEDIMNRTRNHGGDGFTSRASV